jgi:hypothetical protein
MNLNDVRIPLNERIKWIEDNNIGGFTPFYEEIDKGPCMSKICKDPEMSGKVYWRVPALVNDVLAYVCKDCHDVWNNSKDEYWLPNNIRGIENPNKLIP